MSVRASIDRCVGRPVETRIVSVVRAGLVRARILLRWDVRVWSYDNGAARARGDRRNREKRHEMASKHARDGCRAIVSGEPAPNDLPFEYFLHILRTPWGHLAPEPQGARHASGAGE
jgi:hypothetical protein